MRASAIAAACCATALLGVAAAAPPQRNLLLQVRMIDGDTAAADETPARADVTVATRRAGNGLAEMQELQVRNGERASMHFARALPFQWIRAVASAPGAASGASAAQGGGVAYGMTWLEAGQGLAVWPRWPGGQAPVTVEIRFESSLVEERIGPEPPAASRQQAGTTLLVPLERWTTFAAVGPMPQANTGRQWSTTSAAAPPRRVMQLRVSVPD